jgi:hypothetical protein
MPFEVLRVEGKVLMRDFSHLEGMILNACTKYQHELPAEDIALLRSMSAY